MSLKAAAYIDNLYTVSGFASGATAQMELLLSYLRQHWGLEAKPGSKRVLITKGAPEDILVGDGWFAFEACRHQFPRLALVLLVNCHTWCGLSWAVPSPVALVALAMLVFYHALLWFDLDGERYVRNTRIPTLHCVLLACAVTVYGRV